MSAGVGAIVLLGRVLFSIFFVTSGWGHLTKGKARSDTRRRPGSRSPISLAGRPVFGCSAPQRPSRSGSGPTSGL